MCHFDDIIIRLAFKLQLLIVYCLPPPHNSQQQLQLGESLLWASRDGNVRRVTEILDKGAPVNWRDSVGWTALHVASYDNRAEIVKVLLKHHPLINQQDGLSRTPLHFACWRGYLDCVKLLLATGQCDLG